jgi:hypothetical protein
MGILNDIRDLLSRPSIDDEHLYAQVAREIDAGHRREGLWAKALSEANFDHNKAQALYMRMAVIAIQREQAELMENAYGLFDQGRYQEALEGLTLNLEKRNDAIAAACLAYILWHGLTSEGVDRNSASNLIDFAERATDPKSRTYLAVILEKIDWRRALTNYDFSANKGDQEAIKFAKDLRKELKAKGLLPKSLFQRLIG